MLVSLAETTKSAFHKKLFEEIKVALNVLVVMKSLVIGYGPYISGVITSQLC